MSTIISFIKSICKCFSSAVSSKKKKKAESSTAEEEEYEVIKGAHKTDADNSKPAEHDEQWVSEFQSWDNKNSTEEKKETKKVGKAVNNSPGKKKMIEMDEVAIAKEKVLKMI